MHPYYVQVTASVKGFSTPCVKSLFALPTPVPCTPYRLAVAFLWICLLLLHLPCLWSYFDSGGGTLEGYGLSQSTRKLTELLPAGFLVPQGASPTLPHPKCGLGVGLPELLLAVPQMR